MTKRVDFSNRQGLLGSLFAKHGVRGAIPWLAGSRIVSMFLSIITSVLVARAIGPEGRGVVEALLLFAGAVFAIGNLGVGQGVFFLQSRGEQTPAEGFTAIVIISGLVVAVLPAAVWLSGGTGFLPKALTMDRGYVAAAIALAGGPFFVIFCYDLLRGLGRAQIPAVIPVLSQIPVALVTVGVLIAGGGTSAIVGTYVLAAILTASLSLWALHLLGAIGWRLSFRALVDSIRFGWLLYLNGLFAFGFSRASQGIILQRFGVKELGVFGVAVMIAELLSSLEAPVTAAAQYHISERNREEAALLCARLTKVLVGVMVIAATGFLFAGPIVIYFAFGPDFNGAIIPFIVYLPSVVAASVARPLGSFLMFQLKRSDIVLVTSAAGAFMNILLSVAIIGRWKLVGLAAAASLAQIMMLIVYLNKFQRASGFRLRAFLVPTMEDWRLISGPIIRRVSAFWI